MNTAYAAAMRRGAAEVLNFVIYPLSGAHCTRMRRRSQMTTTPEFAAKTALQRTARPDPANRAAMRATHAVVALGTAIEHALGSARVSSGSA
jgi:hypothetical protein